jgi:hypothetical protein
LKALLCREKTPLSFGAKQASVKPSSCVATVRSKKSGFKITLDLFPAKQDIIIHNFTAKQDIYLKRDIILLKKKKSKPIITYD